MFKLALKLFPRMLRSKAFVLLLSALVVACATITAISMFIERIDNTLSSEASSFIAADAKIVGSLEVPDEWKVLAKENQLKTSSFIGFRAMTFSESSMLLTQVKAVDSEYPLRGVLQVSQLFSDVVEDSDSGPQPGYAWLAPRLFAALDIQPGDKIKVGNAEFIAETAISKEPDSAQSAFGLEPRVMIHLDDVPATEAVQVGSRINYSFLLAGQKQDIQTFKAEIENQLGEHHRWMSPEDGSRAFNSAMDRAQQFLLLSGSLSVILAGVAIALAAHRFAVSQHGQVALLKTLGVVPNHIQRLYLILLLALGLLGFLLGSLIGWIAHYGILTLLSDLIPQDLAALSHQSFFLGFITVLVTLFAFAAPPLLSLKQISPTQILRSESGKYQSTLVSSLLGISATVLLILFYSRDWLISGILLLGLFACVLISLLLSSLMFVGINKAQSNFRSHWRLGLANLQRQRSFTTLQVFIFACVALLLTVLFQVRTSLLQNWKPLLDDTPNHFMFNVFEGDLEGIKDYFVAENISMNTFFPMSRGRFTHINDIPVKERIIPGEDINDYERELNLTWSRTMSADNKIVSGEWWQLAEKVGNVNEGNADEHQKELLVSAEKEYAEGLGLELGDQLRFSIAGREFVATLSSIRSVRWDSMNPNFFMIFNQPIADNFAANWITSFYLPKEQKNFLNQLSRTYPTISLIEVDQTLDLVKGVVSKVSIAIEFILLLVGIASILVLLTSVFATLDERLRESALLRSFGANRQFVQKVQLVEFASIGFLAGVFATIVAEICLYYIQTMVFRQPYSLSYSMWITTPLISTVVIALIGYLSTLSATHVPPSQALRQQHAA
jgi:putative ABC transport system permease protein